MALIVTGNDTKPAIAVYSEDFITGQEEILSQADAETQEDEYDDASA
jgi:hypothetical protein